MESIVRLSSLKISNIKNVRNGQIIMPYTCKKQLSYKEAEVLGLYGQNGSGKTAVIDTLYYLQRIMTGNTLDAEIADLKADTGIVLEGEQEENMELIMSVPLEVSVEIGRTKKLVKDILDFTKGSLVVLDKLAGEQVDLYVNGQCIAKGDVVVVEDNFGIRITEIMKVNLIALEQH